MDYHGIILKLKDRYPANSTKFHIELMKEAIRRYVADGLEPVIEQAAENWVENNPTKDLDFELIRDEIYDTDIMHKAIESFILRVLKENEPYLACVHGEARANSIEYQQQRKGEAEIDEYLARR